MYNNLSRIRRINSSWQKLNTEIARPVEQIISRWACISPSRLKADLFGHGIR